MELAWGKCKVWTSKLEKGKPTTWKEWPTPVEDSTNLTPTKGDKKEAKIEGGEYEAVKYGKNTYLVELEVRQGNEDGTPRTKPVEDIDGVVEGEYAMKLQPEDATVAGFTIDRCIISCEDSWNTADGGRWKYTFDALKPSEGNTVKWGVIEDPTKSE